MSSSLGTCIDTAMPTHFAESNKMLVIFVRDIQIEIHEFASSGLLKRNIN